MNNLLDRKKDEEYDILNFLENRIKNQNSSKSSSNFNIENENKTEKNNSISRSTPQPIIQDLRQDSIGMVIRL